MHVERFTAQLPSALHRRERHPSSRRWPDPVTAATSCCTPNFAPRRAGSRRSRTRMLLAGVQVVHVDGVDTGRNPPPRSPARIGIPHVAGRGRTGDPRCPIEVFEADLLLMPRFVHTIAAYQLSRPERIAGAARWTHIFRAGVHRRGRADGRLPDASDPLGLGGTAGSTRVPEFIVRERICHSYCRTATPVLMTRLAAAQIPAGRMFGLAFACGSSAEAPWCRPGCAPEAAATTGSAG